MRKFARNVRFADCELPMFEQMTIFDLIKTNQHEWERFRDNYCKKQMGYFRFDENGQITKDYNFEVVKGCCFRPKHLEKYGDNWQPCTFDRCPFVKGD